jgi:predicted nucleotidyltransferase
MRPPRPPLNLPIFRSARQAHVLARIYLEPGRSWTLQELIRGSGGSRAGVDREIRLLADAGLVTIERVGRTRLFSAAVDSPIASPLRELIEKTLGLEPRLRSALRKVPGLDAAAMFGSWASGTASPNSDVDVLVVGDVDHETVIAQLHAVGDSVGREINVVTFTRAELHDRAQDGTGFLARVLRSETIDLIGDARSLAFTDDGS